MASSRVPVSERSAAWRLALAPWIQSLDERISIAVPTLPDRDAIARHLWVRFAVPDLTESSRLQATGYVERAWVQWLEGFELLDLLARVDSAACWTLLLEICDATKTLRRHACPTEFFYGVLPRYELRFAESFAPSDRVEALLRGGQRRPSSPAFTQTKSLLLTALRGARPSHDQAKPLRLSPVRLRFWFVLPLWHDSNGERDALRIHYNATVRFLKRVLALAKDLPTTWKPRAGRFFVGAFGFYLPVANMRDGVRTLIGQIATHVPIFSLTYQRGDTDHRNLFGPFLWALLPTQTQTPPVAKAAPRAPLGLRKLAVSGFAAQGNEVAALCASIGQSQSLREVSLLDDGASRWEFGPLWFSCLAFALFHSSATHQIHTAQLKLDGLGVEAMVRVLTEANPAIFIAALHTGPTTEGMSSPPPLTKLRVRGQAKVLVPLKGTTNASEARTLSQRTEDVECFVACQHYGNYIRVLAPGVGLCCVHRKDVVHESIVEEKQSHPVRSLTLRVTGEFDVASIALLLAIIGAPLTELALLNVGTRHEEVACLNALLAACPRLQRLELSRVTLSQNAFAPNGWGRELESLTLRGCDVVQSDRESPCTVTRTMFPRLASIVVDARGTTHPLAVQNLLAGLAIARDVQRFVVMSDDEEIKAIYQSLLEQGHTKDGDHIPALPLRHKLALLSAVPVGGGCERAPRTKFVLNTDVLTAIMEMAAPIIRQRICTFSE